MVGFAGVHRLVAADEAGRTHMAHWRKVPSQASIAGWWVDLSMAAGNPKPNFYVGGELEATALDGFDGIFHGDDKAPGSKHLVTLGLMSPTAGFVCQFKLVDYLLFYPFIDGDSADEQPMVNDVSLPRYSTAGGQVMAVAVAPSAGAGSFEFTYTNQDGDVVTSPVQSCSTTAANIATLVTSQQGVVGCNRPFLRLADGDTGVRRVESVRFLAPNGGLIALVIVHPITDHAIREVGTPAEKTWGDQFAGAPRIEDGAYLGLLCNSSASVAAGLLSGYARFVWSD